MGVPRWVKWVKMGKNGLAHIVSYGAGADPKPFNMTFYDSLGMFLVIFGDFGFFRFLCTRARPRASSHIFETTENSARLKI